VTVSRGENCIIILLCKPCPRCFEARLLHGALLAESGKGMGIWLAHGKSSSNPAGPTSVYLASVSHDQRPSHDTHSKPQKLHSSESATELCERLFIVHRIF
jgi:hypothetical protein